MQVVISVDNAFGPNPDFDSSQNISAANWPEVAIPRGALIDHPDAYLLCQGSDPRAEPFDDEAKAIHAEYMANREKVLAARAAAADDAGDEVDPENKKTGARRRPQRNPDLTGG